MSKSIIFHYPRPIVKGGTSGSFVRPALMLEAFEQLGYQVELVAGYLDQRVEVIKQIQRDIARGKKFEFLYSESTNDPILFLERKNLDNRRGLYIKWLFNNNPYADFEFFGWLKEQGIPIGLFCRDVHWRFEHYRFRKVWYKRLVRVLLFQYDWWRYAQLVDHLFLPTLEMYKAMPYEHKWPEEHISALPPGCEPFKSCHSAQDEKKLNLFYVGGIAPPTYDLRPGFAAVQELDDVLWTVCCRPKEWTRYKSYYEPFIDTSKVRIVHAYGQELKSYYAEADLFFLIWEPYVYWKHTISLKVLETLGYGLPMVTVAGTIAAEFVEQEGTGWVVSSRDELLNLLKHLQANPKVIREKQSHILNIQDRHTWKQRAKTAADILSQLS